MRDAAGEALLFVEGKERIDLDTDRKLLLSIVKEIEIIGEAAGRVSDECRKEFPEIPWREITAMRNRLIHAYFDINPDIVWSAVTEELPRLLAALEKIPGR